MTDLTAFGPHDPICPAPHASDVCMCPWIAKARVDEREKVKAEYVPVLMEHLRILSDLRAKVEALPDAHHYGTQQGGHVQRSDVLSLIDGGSDD